jgi:hypothetical protein
MSRAGLGLLAAVVLMSASLTGCGGDDSSPVTSTSSSASGTISRAPTPAASADTGTTAVASQPANSAASTAPPAVTLSWEPPTENADGTPLVDLKGYTVHYGAKSKTYSDSIQVANPGLTTYVVQNLAAGKYYFAVTAYNSKGEESALSPEVATQVD